ncbi:MAG: hypothetical protein KBT06_00740 [Prevotellaceae bacterium]|nr:hypothetical protein [Candidatus Colivivens equi]
MKQGKLQILMLIPAFFLMSNAFGQTNGFYLLNQGNGKYLQMVKAATDTSTGNNNDGQLGFIDSKDASTTCWTFTQCSSTKLVKFANSGNDNVVYFGQPNTQNQAWSYKLCGLAKYNSGTNSTAKASNQSDAGAGSKYNCYLYKISNYTATGTSFTATLTTTAEVGGYYFIASANVDQKGSGLMLMGNTINSVNANKGSETQDVIAGTNISDKPNTETITVSVDNIKNYIYLFESNVVKGIKYGKFSYVNEVEGGTASCAEIPSGTSWEGQSEDIAGPATKTFTLTATASNDDYIFKGWSDDVGKTIIDGSNQSPFTYTFSYSSTDEGSPTTVTLTPVFSAGLNFYLMNYDTGNYLNASGTKMSFSSEPQIWSMEESDDYMKISPDGENNLTYSSSYVRLSSSATKYCYLYEIEDIEAENWSGTLTQKPTPGKYYFIVFPSAQNGRYYAMGKEITDGSLGKSDSKTLSQGKFTMTKNSDNKQYVYQFVKPTPGVTYYGELTVVAKDNLGTVSISEATSGNNVWSGPAKGYTGSATKVLNVSATPSEGYTFVGWSENGTNIISPKANYEYSFTFNGTEDAPQKATLTAVFAEKVSYFVYNLGKKQFLKGSSTSLNFSDTPQEWVTEVASDNFVNIMPEGSNNHLYCSSGFNSKTFALSSTASNCWLYEIDDINAKTWTAKLVTIPTTDKCYFIVSHPGSSDYAMGNKISSNKITGTKGLFTISNESFSVENTDANKAYVYQFTKSAYNIPVTSVEWASFYADFDVTIPQGVTAYTATGIDSGKITLAEVEGDVIPAKTAVVFSVAEGKVSFVNKGSVTTFSGTNLFEGSSVEKNIKAESCYTLCGVNNGNPVFKLYTGTILAANKAYLPIPQGTEVKEMLSSVFDGANGIANINVNNDANSVRYNLNGQVVGKDFKGVVIMNGKKYHSK